LPEDPVLRATRQFLHDPCIIKRYIGFPGFASGLCEKFSETKRRKKDEKNLDKINDE
jgi:hypothetical protein